MQSSEERKAYQKKWRQENKERISEKGKLWRKNNPERMEIYKIRQRQYDKVRNSKPGAKENWRAIRLKFNYGMSVEEYQARWAMQDGKCAICRQAESHIDPRTGLVRWLSVDHDHETDENRELLCGDCNRGLGLFSDNFELLLKAAQYLKKHKRKVQW